MKSRLSPVAFVAAMACATEVEPTAPQAPRPEPFDENPPPGEEVVLTADNIVHPKPTEPPCTWGFSSNDATMAFGVAGDLDAGDCTFEGVRAEREKLRLTWKTADARAVEVALVANGCADPTQKDAISADIAGLVDNPCEGLAAQVQEAVELRRFPTATPFAPTP